MTRIGAIQEALNKKRGDAATSAAPTNTHASAVSQVAHFAANGPIGQVSLEGRRNPVAGQCADLPLRDFLARVLPPTGIYNCFTTGDRRNHWAHSPEELAETIEALGGRTDIYYAVASFLSEGTPYKGRTQDNVAALKCFRLDLDAGEKKLQTQGPDAVYATQRDALADLVRFSKEVTLAPTLIVSSGEGLHVYYVLDEAVPPPQWKPVAEALKALCAKHGLKGDPVVTADTVRVLRPVGTRHPNGKAVAVLKDTGKTYTLEEFAQAVGDNTTDGGTDPPARRFDAKALSINADVLPQYDNSPADFELIRSECEALRHAADPATQDSVSEPYWRGGIGIVKFCADAQQLAHEISRHHPEYDPEETERKLDGWNAGPTTCAYFAEHNPNACAGCKHRGKITSPIRLGQPSNAAAPVGADAASYSPSIPEWGETLNNRHAVVRLGSSYVIADLQTVRVTAKGIQRGLGWLEIAAFKQMYRGRTVEVPTGVNDEVKRVPLADAWLSHVGRRQFEGAVFAPGEILPPTVLNLYQGFAVSPIEGDVSIWLRLLEALIPDAETRAYVLHWLAWKVQNPGGVPDTVLIFTGAKGTGKNSLFEPLLAIFGVHGMLVDDPELIAGRFTWHLMDKCLVVLDEAVFIGDPRQQDRIKSRVTAKSMMYEQKGMDPVQGVNRCAYVMLTNHEHAWQATTDERRSVVVEVGSGMRGNFQFWDEYHAWVQGDGPAALLNYLQRVDVSGFNPRRIPRNDALRRQVELTALRDPVVSWWHQCLSEGAIRWRDGGIERAVPLNPDTPTEIDAGALRESFEQSAGARGRGAVGWALAAKRLAGWCGPVGLKKRHLRVGGGSRTYRYQLPPLAELRKGFTASTGVSVEADD